ncbi:hypothetical protein HDV01_006632 [Terramyces sp. JEL0728]|nr:hypothetical protein HDV01_006632 [Terramyces sp. JEL0728]
MHQFFPPNNQETLKLELQIEALNKILNEYSKQEPPLLQRWRSKVYQQMVTHKFEILSKDADINRLQDQLMKYESENQEKDAEIKRLMELTQNRDLEIHQLKSNIQGLEIKSMNDQETKKFEFIKQEKDLLQLEVSQLQKDRKALLQQLLDKPIEKSIQPIDKLQNVESNQEPVKQDDERNVPQEQEIRKLDAMDKLEALDQLSELLLKIV